MADTATALRRALIDALPAHLERRLAALDVEPARFGDAMADAVAAADDGLASLLGLPFDRQPEAPLEIVRRAIAPVTDALEEAGVPAPDRDEEAQRVTPEDTYGLAPASPAELGDEALEASLAWGVAKTKALTRPTALVVTASLLDGSRFEPQVRRAGYRLVTSRDGAADVTPLVAFVDLEVEDADGIVRDLAERGVRVVAYGPHVDDFALARARSLGAHTAEPRSRVLRNPSRFLPPLV